MTKLRDWGVDERARADAELVVSELFTNAVKHTDSVKVSCEIRVIGGRLRVEVTDQGRAEAAPHRRPVEAEPDKEEGGRGLLLVGALSDDWGVRVDHCGGGRVVWADLRYSSLASSL